MWVRRKGERRDRIRREDEEREREGGVKGWIESCSAGILCTHRSM